MTPERREEIRDANAAGKLWSADVIDELLGEVDRLQELVTLPPCPFVPPCRDCQHYAFTPPRVHWTPAASDSGEEA